MASVGCPMMTKSIGHLDRLQTVGRVLVPIGPTMFTRYGLEVRMHDAELSQKPAPER